MVLTRTYEAMPFCEREILRYAGCKEADKETMTLLKECVEEVKDKLKYKVCYLELPLKIEEDSCNFGAFILQSELLASNLNGCENVILFAATIGIEMDRLIAKYGRISPVKALLFQAIGAERIEALCDTFCEDIVKEKNKGSRPRFSPGYGDLPLMAQKKIFEVLTPEKQIGLTLTDSLLMLPSKSVTAIMGLSDYKEKQRKNKCSACNKSDCMFRGAV